MGTRSIIGIESQDGSIKAIYCHWDGYPTHNGAILAEHYTDREKVHQLMELGDLSSLAEEIGEKHDFDWNRIEFDGDFEAYSKDPRYKMCLAYGRDRGEEGCEAQDYANRDELVSADRWEEFTYLLTMTGEWLGYCHYEGQRAWRPLGEMIAEEREREEAA